jgi:hypothetical protein
VATTAKTMRPTAAWCPHCGGDLCRHFVGWTEDGRTFQAADTFKADKRPILESDRIVKTGVSARVYRA